MISDWSWLDILALAVVLASCLAALFKGVLAELVSLASVIVGLLVAIWFHAEGEALLLRLGLGELAAYLASFFFLFLGCLVAGAVIGHLADSLLRALHLKWADRLLGGVFGLLRGWLIVAVVFLAMAAFPVGSRVVAQSQTSTFFLTSAGILVELAPKDFQQRFEQGYREIYQQWIQPNEPEKGRQ